MDLRKLRALEGLGYVAAVMIGVGGIVDDEVTRIFNVLGLVFAIIVIVRLMVMQIIYNEGANLGAAGRMSGDVENLPDLGDSGISEPDDR